MDQMLHPRPQMQRSQWYSLDGSWKFAYDDANRYIRPKDVLEWPLTINVPFAPETERSGIQDTSFHPVCWYEREFEIPHGEDRLLLHFGAVDYFARVWVNDEFVVEHEGGHTPFKTDITHALRGQGPQRISVQVLDDPHDLAKPRGKQDWMLEPHSIWYPRTTGIWQSVWLERVPHTYLEQLRWTPHLEDWQITVEAYIAGDLGQEMRIGVKLSQNGGVLADDNYAVICGEVVRRIVLADPGIDDYRNEILWSPEDPKLIEAEVTLWDGNKLVDRIQSYTALRSVYTQRDRFMLNGRPYQLRLVLDQGYWPESFMTPPSDEALRKDIELVKAMGFNGVRKHQKIEDPRFLYWADKMGLMVWEEMPSAYRFTNKAIQRLMREWKEVIDRDYSHPCIVTWVPFNESWGVPDLPKTATHRDAVQAFYHLTKTLDPTRPVIGNDGWESTATDIIGIHDYDKDPENLRERYGPKIVVDELFDRRRPGGRILTLDGYPHKGQPIMLTEFGGIAFAKEDDPLAEKIWGYTSTDDAQDFEQRYTAYLENVNNIGIFSGFCYTQFTDTFQEANGLLYADRTPKIPIETIRSATCRSR